MTNQPFNEHITVLFIFLCYYSLKIHKKLLNPRKIIIHKLKSTQGDKLRVADAPEEDRKFFDWICPEISSLQYYFLRGGEALMTFTIRSTFYL